MKSEIRYWLNNLQKTSNLNSVLGFFLGLDIYLEKNTSVSTTVDQNTDLENMPSEYSIAGCLSELDKKCKVRSNAGDKLLRTAFY